MRFQAQDDPKSNYYSHVQYTCRPPWLFVGHNMSYIVISHKPTYIHT